MAKDPLARRYIPVTVVKDGLYQDPHTRQQYKRLWPLGEHLELVAGMGGGQFIYSPPAGDNCGYLERLEDAADMVTEGFGIQVIDGRAFLDAAVLAGFCSADNVIYQTSSGWMIQTYCPNCNQLLRTPVPKTVPQKAVMRLELVCSRCNTSIAVRGFQIVTATQRGAQE